MKSIRVNIKRRENAKDLPLPRYITPGSSGMDLHADVDGELILKPGEIKLISCGISLSLPEGFEGEIRPRSGLALKHGITLVNAPGTIDSDYRGQVNLIMTNLGKSPFRIKRGDRIAQLIVKEVVRAELVEAEELDETVRASGGFGHTGV
ncbi:MAG: dUTP diphosphatase [Candidatus Omnitrophota bacterium]|nr:MAG: dUTP diphosphatase [Candidatus Omnitrophota bacterium]